MTIDFNSAVPVSLSERRTLPASAGVYVVVEGEEVAYVGYAKNVRARWRNHHVTKLVSPESTIYCFLMDAEAAKQAEAQFIWELRPKLNQKNNRPFTLTVGHSPTPRYASVHEALAANVDVIAALIVAGRTRQAASSEQPQPMTEPALAGESAAKCS